jgi:tetratricopeptide (TPR) repeat protein
LEILSVQILQNISTWWVDARANTFRDHAQTWLLRADYDRVLKTCDRALRLNPELAEVYNWRGCARLRLGDATGAVEDFDAALVRQPKYVEAYLNRGLAHLALDEIPDALGDFNMAIYLNPRQQLAYNHRGLADERQGNVLGAIEDYRQYLALGGGRRYGDQSEVELLIASLRGSLVQQRQ